MTDSGANTAAFWGLGMAGLEVAEHAHMSTRRWMPKAAAALLALGAAGLGGKLLASPTTVPAPAPSRANDAPVAMPVVAAVDLAPSPIAPAAKAVPAPKTATPRPRVKPSVAAPAPASAPSPELDLIDPYR